MSNLGNPIKSLSSGSRRYLVNSTTPCEFVVGRYDVSASTAGRDEAGEMHKDMIGKSTKYELKFHFIDSQTVHDICQVVEAGEFVNITLVDPVDGYPPSFTVTRTFYVGDRSMSLYNAALDLWQELSFSLIEKGVH